MLAVPSAVPVRQRRHEPAVVSKAPLSPSIKPIASQRYSSLGFVAELVHMDGISIE
jgi:hypothetical protein